MKRFLVVVLFLLPFGLYGAALPFISGPQFPFAGNVEKLKDPESGGCGEYFKGTDSEEPNAVISWTARVVDGHLAEQGQVILINMSAVRKFIVVIQDDERKVPYTGFKVIPGKIIAEVQISSADIRASPCLPKPMTWKSI